MTRTRHNPLPALLILTACAILALVILQQHAVTKHGLGVNLTRSAFDRCDQLPGAEYYSPERQTWLYFCFVDQARMAVQVLTEQRGADGSKEITTIPAEHVSKPYNYARSVITRDGYQLRSTWGDLPEWFQVLGGLK